MVSHPCSPTGEQTSFNINNEDVKLIPKGGHKHVRERRQNGFVARVPQIDLFGTKILMNGQIPDEYKFCYPVCF